MKPLYLTLALLFCSFLSQAQIVSLPHGAKITVDTLTTELTVISPGVVEVTKYIGRRPSTSTPNFQLGGETLPDSLPRTEGGGKLKIDTGRFYAAINAKDGNVSFWDYDGNLLLAEQHRTASLTPSGKKDSYDVRQDFQIGKSQADSIYCGTLPSAKRKNLKGTRVAFGDKAAGLPQRLVSTDKGYSILWNTPGNGGHIDDSPGRQVKKPGDVTFSSPRTTAIQYYFLLR